MPDCPPFALKQNHAVKKTDDACEVSMDPEITPGCTFSVTLDGTPVSSGNEVGDFRCTGLDGKGKANFRVLRDNPRAGWVHFYVTCAECGPTRSTNGIFLGSGRPANYYATQFFKTVGLVLTIPLLLLFGGNWLACKIICLIWRPPAGQVCECTTAKEALDAALGMLPDWVKAPFK
jgi:hypothetical protein